MNAVEILEKAKSLIDHPSKWTIGAYARDGAEKPVAINSPDACKFCVMGALYKSFGYSYAPDAHDKPAFREAWKLLSDSTGDKKLGLWNDTLGRDHSDVMNAFDKAIESLKGE